jgi:acyl carrier protein
MVIPLMSTSEFRASVRDFLMAEFPEARARGVSDEEPLLESGVLDSLGVLELANFIGERFSLTLEDDDLTPENFGSIAAVARLLEARLR